MELSTYKKSLKAFVSFFQHIFGMKTAEEKIEEERQHHVAVCWLFTYVVISMNYGGQNALYIRNWEP